MAARAPSETSPAQHGPDGHDPDLIEVVGSDVHAESKGLPQLKPEESLFISQLVWLAITFGFLYLVMARFALPRIATVIEERRDKIALDIDKAGAFKRETDEAIEAYETALREAKARAQKTIEETRRRVKAEMEDLRTTTEQDLEEKLRSAESRIDAAKERALLNIRDLATDLTRSILDKVHQDGPAHDNRVAQAIDTELTARNLS
ncbi:MAG: F0F1 ATP synthase subunit B' [Alphaproteobacteria bacterium]